MLDGLHRFVAFFLFIFIYLIIFIYKLFILRISPNTLSSIHSLFSDREVTAPDGSYYLPKPRFDILRYLVLYKIETLISIFD